MTLPEALEKAEERRERLYGSGRVRPNRPTVEIGVHPPRTAGKRPLCRDCGGVMGYLHYGRVKDADYWGCRTCPAPWEGTVPLGELGGRKTQKKPLPWQEEEADAARR